jgi:transcriptional regulator with XRE-family HTH domain
LKLSDIARLAGVSVTTASYVINGKAEQQRISAATVERVRAVVDAHGFTPNPQAAGLRSRHTRTLGFILPDLENPSYARIAKIPPASASCSSCFAPGGATPCSWPPACPPKTTATSCCKAKVRR